MFRRLRSLPQPQSRAPAGRRGRGRQGPLVRGPDRLTSLRRNCQHPLVPRCVRRRWGRRRSRGVSTAEPAAWATHSPAGSCEKSPKSVLEGHDWAGSGPATAQNWHRGGRRTPTTFPAGLQPAHINHPKPSSRSPLATEACSVYSICNALPRTKSSRWSIRSASIDKQVKVCRPRGNQPTQHAGSKSCPQHSQTVERSASSNWSSSW